MTKMDVNGNTVTTSTVYCKALIRGLPAGTTYTTDAFHRIMVTLADGGYIVFFEQDEPHVTAKVKERFVHVDG